MKIYSSKYRLLPATSLAEAIKLARLEYRTIQKHAPRRQAYVRSRFFTKDKIFVNDFWRHLNQKTRPDQLRRVRLFTCAIDVMRNTTYDSELSQNPSKSYEALHRFYGRSKDGMVFCVQIKENKKTHRKHFMSVFPIKD